MEEELYAEVLLAESETKQALYTFSEKEYLALTPGKAKVKIVPVERIVNTLLLLLNTSCLEAYF